MSLSSARLHNGFLFAGWITAVVRTQKVKGIVVTRRVAMFVKFLDSFENGRALLHGNQMIWKSDDQAKGPTIKALGALREFFILQTKCVVVGLSKNTAYWPWIR